MFTKAKIFNQSLSLLLINREIADAETDRTKEAVVLRNNWDVAWAMTLEDLDLDRTRSIAPLQLLAQDPNEQWGFAYRYPSDCAFFRRISNTFTKDNAETHTERSTGQYNGISAIFTHDAVAYIDYISKDVSLGSLNAWAGMALAANLAMLSAPLITGKGAKTIIEAVEKKYVLYKAKATELDARENFNYPDPETESEFVRERMS